MPAPRQRDDSPDVDCVAMRRAAREEVDRENEEAPTSSWSHKPPCGEHRAFRAYCISAAGAALGIAGYLWLRMDSLSAGATTRAIAIAAITTRLDNIDRSLERIENAVAGKAPAAKGP